VNLPAAVRQRLQGDYEIDEWGLDAGLVSAVSPLFGARWRIDVEQAANVPAAGAAVLVFNRRIGLSEPFVLTRGVRLAVGRFLRTVGVPDIAPVGPVLRRLGGVLDRPDEITGLLHAGALVAVPMAREVRRRTRAGGLPTRILEPALLTGAPVVPVAVVGRELGRSWRVVVGRPVAPPVGQGPLAAVELAETTRRRVQQLLDGAMPPSWPFG
jgi:hypothetical protein